MATIDLRFKEVKCPKCGQSTHCSGAQSGGINSTQLTCNDPNCNTTILIVLIEPNVKYEIKEV